MNEQETDVEEGGTMLEEKRGRKVGGMKEVGRYNDDDVDSGVEENDEEKNDLEDVENAEDVDVDADGDQFQLMSLTHHVLSLSLNLTQVTYWFPHAHIYVSLLRYLVPHHLLTHLLHVHLRLCSRAYLCGEEEEGSLSTGVWLCTFSKTTGNKLFLNMCIRTS